MLHTIIQDKKNKWLQSDDCTIRDLVKYIRDKGHFVIHKLKRLKLICF
jgi:hypothetical protein